MSSDAFAEPVVVPDQRTSKATLAELRKTRQRRRLGETDWYDIAYRVYLFALVGLALVVWVSEAVDGLIGDGIDSADLLERGPAIIGLVEAMGSSFPRGFGRDAMCDRAPAMREPGHVS